MKKLLTGIGSLVVLLAFLVGIPALLLLVAGNPIPSIDELQAAFTRPDYGGQFLLGTVLPIVAWVAWATFAVSVFTVLPSAIRRIEPPRIPGLRFQQKTATALLGAVIIMFTGLAGTAGAMAATPASSYSSTQSDQAAAAPSTSEDAAETATASESGSLPTYVVQSGDTLWTIAEAELGDGKRYSEIAQLNEGVTQEDGGQLTAENRWVAPGWILELPADAGTHAAADVAVAPAAAPAAAVAATPAEAAAAPLVAVDEHVVVEAGDTLWGIAEEEYGAGERYPEIFEASKGTLQAGGQQISDPNLILPGWDVIVPGAGVAAAPVAPAAPPAPVTPPPGENTTSSVGEGTAIVGDGAQDGSGGVGGAAETAGPSEEAVTEEANSPAAEGNTTTAASDDEDFLDDAFANPTTMTAGGIGALLAAGILGLLGVRRFQQRRRRKPGERISMPAVEIATTELELRTVEDPQGVDDVDRTLRYLASWAQRSGERLPKLFAVRLSASTVELYLDEPAQLPDPFVQTADDQTAWSVLPGLIPDFAPRPTSPYPGLVTLGQDPTNGHILVDLERIGSLNIAGPTDEITEGALTALAIELACSKWADDLQITIVGFAPELADALGTGRIQYVDDVSTLMSTLRGRTRAYTHAFDDLHVTSPQQARTTADTDSWTPEIVLLRHLPDEKTQAELVALIEHSPRVGIAAISNGQLSGSWALNIAADHSAVLSPAGISIRAQVVAGDEYQHILTSLAVTAQEAQSTPVIEETPTEAEAIRLETETETAPASGWDFDEDDVDAPAKAETSLAAAEPDVEEPLELPAPTAPVIRLLGQIRVDGAKGPEPRTEKTTYVAPATELLVYLALNPRASGGDVSETMWPGKRDTATSNRNQLMSRARRWLGGTEGDDSEFYVPNISTSQYSLHPDVKTDWDYFKDLVGSDLSKTPTRNLVAAMKLVEGQPFSGAPRRRYGWVDSFRQEMIAAIVDAAHELAERSLSIRDVATARMASIVGEKVDPASEIPVRDRLRAEALANDVDGFERVVERLDIHLAELEEDEPEEETAQLIDELRSHRMAS